LFTGVASGTLVLSFQAGKFRSFVTKKPSAFECKQPDNHAAQVFGQRKIPTKQDEEKWIMLGNIYRNIPT
jgi:hypothetical protein